MSIEIVVPELGESVLEATVMQWFKQEGEHVKVGEVLVELETDKVNLEVGAERGGILARIERSEGQDVAPGDVLGFIEEVEDEEPLPERQEALEPGVLVEEKEGRAPRRPESEVNQEPRVTPLARQVAEDNQVDLAQVRGTGSGGRVTRQDVETYLEKTHQVTEADQETTARSAIETPARPMKEPPSGPAKSLPPAAAEAQVETRRWEERVRMSRRRRTIASRLVEAQHTAAMLTTFNEVDMDAVMALRKRRNEDIQERYGVKVGITSFFVKAAIGALKAFPRLNAEIEGDEMVLKHYYDIGIAVGAQEGLVVPVIRDADRLSLIDIDRQISEYARKAEESTLLLEDLQGGTFTITNGGVFGSLLSTPILNPPQVGILGLHKIEPRPIAVAGEVEIHAMMYVAVSYDHRIVDGREAVQFLARIKELVEDPEKLLLEG
jgi:2-oxoglutarate dehydrogenase E2 component (dihydrolipoamide succinyltransferase)